jgi:hypothetical protein
MKVQNAIICLQLLAGEEQLFDLFHSCSRRQQNMIHDFSKLLEKSRPDDVWNDTCSSPIMFVTISEDVPTERNSDPIMQPANEREHGLHSAPGRS